MQQAPCILPPHHHCWCRLSCFLSATAAGRLALLPPLGADMLAEHYLVGRRMRGGRSHAEELFLDEGTEAHMQGKGSHAAGSEARFPLHNCSSSPHLPVKLIVACVSGSRRRSVLGPGKVRDLAGSDRLCRSLPPAALWIDALLPLRAEANRDDTWMLARSSGRWSGSIALGFDETLVSYNPQTMRHQFLLPLPMATLDHDT